MASYHPQLEKNVEDVKLNPTLGGVFLLHFWAGGVLWARISFELLNSKRQGKMIFLIFHMGSTLDRDASYKFSCQSCRYMQHCMQPTAEANFTESYKGTWLKITIFALEAELSV